MSDTQEGPRGWRDPATIPEQEAGYCGGCGAPSEPGKFDVAIHNCDDGSWDYITLTVPIEGRRQEEGAQ